MINNGIDIPKFDFIPYQVNDLAYSSYFGGRFEMLKRGFIGTAYLYDVNSAYPYALTQFQESHKENGYQENQFTPMQNLASLEF